MTTTADLNLGYLQDQLDTLSVDPRATEMYLLGSLAAATDPTLWQRLVDASVAYAIAGTE